MPKIVGRLIDVGIAKETVRGTAVAPTYWLPKLELDFEDKAEKVLNESGYGNIDKNSDADVTQQWGEGAINGKIFDKSYGLLLAGVFGAAPTSALVAGESAIYEHTYARLNSNQHLSLTLAIKEPNLDQRFAMAMIDNHRINAVTDDYATHETDFVSKKGVNSTNTVAYAAENEFLPKHILVKLAATEGGLDAASALAVRSVSLEIAKNLERTQVLGSTDPDDIMNTVVEVTGEIELYYQDNVHKTSFLNNTNQAMRIQLLNSDVALGVVPSRPTITFDMPKVSFTDWSRELDNDDPVTQTIEFTALFDIATGKTISAKVINGVASY